MFAASGSTPIQDHFSINSSDDFTRCKSNSIEDSKSFEEAFSSISPASSFDDDVKKIETIFAQIQGQLVYALDQPSTLDIPSLIISVSDAQERFRKMRRIDRRKNSSESTESVSDERIGNLLLELRSYGKTSTAMPTNQNTAVTITFQRSSDSYRSRVKGFSEPTESMPDERFEDFLPQFGGREELPNVAPSQNSPRENIKHVGKKKHFSKLPRSAQSKEPAEAASLWADQIYKIPTEEELVQQIVHDCAEQEKRKQNLSRSTSRPSVSLVADLVSQRTSIESGVTHAAVPNNFHRKTSPPIAIKSAQFLSQNELRDPNVVTRGRKNSPLSRFSHSPRRAGASSSPRVNISVQDKDYIEITFNSDGSCRRWVENILNKMNLEKVEGLNTSVALNINSEYSVSGSAINNYGLEVVERSKIKLIKSDISREDLLKKTEGLAFGLFEFTTLNDRLKHEVLEMKPDDLGLRLGVYDKEARRIFSCVEKSTLCDFVLTPMEVFESENVSDISKLRIKINPTTVLTSGSGVGELSRKAAEKTAQVIKLDVDDAIAKWLKKKGSDHKITLASVIKMQIKAINLANEILRKESDVYGTTEVAVANIVDGHLIVTNVGNIKTFIVRKRQGLWHSFELEHKPSQSLIGGVSKIVNQLSSTVLKLDDGDYQILICSKGAYANLDPAVIEEFPVDWEVRSKERSQWMANRVKDIFGFCDSEVGLEKVFRAYNQAMAFDANKRNIVSGGLSFDLNFRSQSSSKESEEASKRAQLAGAQPEEKASPKGKAALEEAKKSGWEGLVNGNGRPGFVAFAILAYNSGRSNNK